jgi:NitT/TauT family transport system permease protein
MRLINAKPSRVAGLFLGILPFALIVAAYSFASALRRASNPSDRLLPSLQQMGGQIADYAFRADPRTGTYLLWFDTGESLLRLGLGIAVSAMIALVLGIAIGFIPRVRATLAPLVAALSLVPPLALLPILFIVFGLGELSKVVLIVIGITPIMTRDLANRVAEIPQEQIVKAQTLGASTWQMILRIVLPQVLPRLLVCLRLALGPAWLFLIAAEAVASTGGLGYRIFLVRRYFAMDVILPYVAWITILAYMLDLILRTVSRRAFAWAHLDGGGM